MSDSKDNANKGPIYGVELIDSLPLGDESSMMRQAMPSRGDLVRVRSRCERMAAGYEVLLSHWRRLRRVVDYVNDPQVLVAIPRTHRLALLQLMGVVDESEAGDD